MSLRVDVDANDLLRPRERPRERRRRRRRPGAIAFDVLVLVVGLLMAAPLVWLFAASATEPGEAFTLPPKWLPSPFSTENYSRVLELMPFGRMALNSLIVAVISVGGSLLVAVLAAYAFSRLSFTGRDKMLVVMLSALMVPAQLTIIPVFVLMRNLNLVDTLTSLWLPALINVFAIFFLRQYFNSIPRELDEAARIDGAGHLWILFRMLVPLSGPALSALAILGFQASWNNYFGPLIFISSPEKMTLPLGLVTLQSGQGGAPAAVVFAAIAMVVAPVLVLFLAFQRNFVASVATAGLRG
ncbi:carbohydrate ABC transporter permease [Jiangella anatolica]|uniref:Carbohydrate ABC transporter permease n=1 Tax=Jiangella anatolica TaxID=2670374 RepID=A0A2W2BKP0_9ACTN|nr:carbohydrate ABC transporter permease [Jiangella anatolica]PZF80878.1 carbohydrate ABC transporter permease [Jiangella anatolica]